MSNNTESNGGNSPEAVEKYLYDLTGNYHYQNENVDVKLGSMSYAALNGDHIGISQHFGADLAGPQRLRLQGDTVSHEMYHINESDLESKKNFSDKNDVAPKTAGVVINVVEDHYVDYQRTTDFPGQRKSLAYKLQVQIEEADNPKFYHIDNQPNKAKALVNGLLQVSALGFPLFDNVDAVDDDVLDFLTWARAKVMEVRDMTPENMSNEDISKKFTASGDMTPQYRRAMEAAWEAREEVAQEIFDTLMGHLDDPSKADDHVDNTGMFDKEIPDDVDMRPMTPEEREEFDQKREDMPTIDMDMDMDMDMDADGDSSSSGDGDSQPSPGSGGGSESGSESGENADDAGDDQQGSESGDGDETGDEDGQQDGDGAGGAGDDEQDGDADDSAGGGSDGDEGDDDGDGDESGGAGDGDDDEPPTCSDCGKPLLKKPRHEVENQGAMSDASDDTLMTDGGSDMVYVCPDCGEVVDPETGEHQGDTDADGDEGDETEDGQSGGDGEQQDGDGDESGSGGDDGQDSDEDGQPDGDGDADGDGDESGDDGAGGDESGDGDESGTGDESGDGEDGQQDGDESGESGSESGEDDEQNGGGSQSDPLSEEDNTHYDDERHDTQHITRDELARERDDMLNLGRSKDVQSFWGVDDREDVSNVESRFVRRWQKIKVEEDADEDALVTRQKARDERMRRPVASIGHEAIRSEVMQDGLADAIEEAFRELKTRDRYQPSRAGEDLNMDAVITNRSLGYETQPNYQHKQRAEKGDRAVGVSLDMSNSMNEKKAKVALGGLYVATEIIGDKLIASAYHSQRNGGRGSDHAVHTPLITGPDEEFNWKHLDAIRPTDWTPTPSGVIDAKKLLKQASRPEKVLIVITDGKPNVMPNGENSGNKALDASATAVQKARHEGIKVIGLGVGNIDEGNMAAMFGRNGYVMSNSMGTLADDLLEVYHRQMKVVQDN